MKTKTIGALLCVLLLGACAIKQTVKPVTQLGLKEICIIENPAIRAGIVEAYIRTLTDKGYNVRFMPPSTSTIDCPVTSTYYAKWNMTMTNARINVYRDGELAGSASYDATRATANPERFINADSKIVELVNELFPGGASQ